MWSLFLGCRLWTRRSRTKGREQPFPIVIRAECEIPNDASYAHGSVFSMILLTLTRHVLPSSDSHRGQGSGVQNAGHFHILKSLACEKNEVTKPGYKYCGTFSSLVLNRWMCVAYIKYRALSFSLLQNVLGIYKTHIDSLCRPGAWTGNGHKLMSRMKNISVFWPHWGFPVTSWIIHNLKFEILCGCEGGPFLPTPCTQRGTAASEDDLSGFTGGQNGIHEAIVEEKSILSLASLLGLIPVYLFLWLYGTFLVLPLPLPPLFEQ